MHQATRDLFVFGDGEFGQLGRGEDVVSAARPLPSLAGTKVAYIAAIAEPIFRVI